MKNLIWMEKHRPSSLDEFIATDELKGKIRELLKKPMAMPNFIFVSKSPGTGKTSLAYVIKNELGCSNRDFLVLNSSDERKIETIRGRVKDFALTMSSSEGIPRIILMDEFDGMLPASQDALRYIMEKYSSNCKFILTANNENKIIEYILSRCTVMRLREIPKEKIFTRLANIAKQEGILETCLPEAITKLIDTFYPDMRSMINKMQELAPDITEDRIKAPKTLENEVYNLLKMRKPFDARAFVLQNGLDSRAVLKYLWERMLKDEDFKAYENRKDKLKEMIYYTAEVTDVNLRYAADDDIELQAWMLKFLDVFKIGRVATGNEPLKKYTHEELEKDINAIMQSLDIKKASSEPQ